MRFVVFTAVIGDTDALKAAPSFSGVDYVCYSDRTQDPELGWKIVRVSPENDGPIALARKIKILAHTRDELMDADATLWIDAAYQLLADPVSVALEVFWKYDMAALRHPDRHGYYEEGLELIRLKKAPADLVNRQMLAYRRHGFFSGVEAPDLTTTGLLFRRNSHRMQKFNRCWWAEFQSAGHLRDQMSVDFAVWRMGIDLHYLQGHYRENPYAKWYSDPTKKSSALVR